MGRHTLTASSACPGPALSAHSESIIPPNSLPPSTTVSPPPVKFHRLLMIVCRQRATVRLFIGGAHDEGHTCENSTRHSVDDYSRLHNCVDHSPRHLLRKVRSTQRLLFDCETLGKLYLHSLIASSKSVEPFCSCVSTRPSHQLRAAPNTIRGTAVLWGSSLARASGS